MFRIDPDHNGLDPSVQRVTGAPASRAPGAMARARAMFLEWRLRARSRVELARLDDRQLADIGLSRNQAAYESGKFFFLR